MRDKTTLKRDGAWLLGWVMLFVGGLSLGAAIYLALKPTVKKTAPTLAASVTETPKPVADLLLETRKLQQADREQLRRLLTLLNITMADNLRWSPLLHPDQVGDGVIALHAANQHYWLQLTMLDGRTEWLPSDASAPTPEFLYALGDKPHLVSGHLPRLFWQSLLPETVGGSCQLWSQLQNRLPERAIVAVDDQPFHLQLRWPWAEAITPTHHLPHHLPAEQDALYSAALMVSGEQCDAKPTMLRLWPNKKDKPQLALLQPDSAGTDSPLAEFPLSMHAVANITGAIASSSEADAWLQSALTKQFDGGELLFHSFVHPTRLAMLRKQKAGQQPAVEVQVWWLNNEIVMDLRWSE